MDIEDDLKNLDGTNKYYKNFLQIDLYNPNMKRIQFHMQPNQLFKQKGERGSWPTRY